MQLRQGDKVTLVPKPDGSIHNVIFSMFSEKVSALRERDVNLVKGLNRRMRDIQRLSLVTNRLLRSLVLFPRSVEQKEVSLIDCVD